MNITFYKFNKDATGEASTEVLTDPKKYVIEKLQSRYSFGTVDIMQTGWFKLMGFAYDFRPFLTKYLYKQYGQWHEAYAINKTNLRKLVYGRIDKIIQL